MSKIFELLLIMAFTIILRRLEFLQCFTYFKKLMVIFTISTMPRMFDLVLCFIFHLPTQLKIKNDTHFM